jgi:hypothetical protein
MLFLRFLATRSWPAQSESRANTQHGKNPRRPHLVTLSLSKQQQPVAAALLLEQQRNSTR